MVMYKQTSNQGALVGNDHFGEILYHTIGQDSYRAGLGVVTSIRIPPISSLHLLFKTVTTR